MIELAAKIYRLLPSRLRSLYNGLSIPHRIFIKEHILIRPTTYEGCRYFTHRALNYEEYFYKYKDAIEEAKKLAIEKGLDPKDLQSSVCPKCEIPMIWKRAHGRIWKRTLSPRGDYSSFLFCLKCGLSV